MTTFDVTKITKCPKNKTYLCHSLLTQLEVRHITFSFKPLVSLLLGFYALIPLCAMAQTPVNPGGYWIAYTGDNKLNKFIGIHSELQGRNFGVARSVETVLVRVGLNVYLKPYAMFTAGYGYIYSNPNDGTLSASRISEHRTWQQLLLRQKTRAIFMDHRYRLEQRFLDNLSTGTSRTEHRIRYRYQVLFPLYTVSPHLRHLFVALNNEIMINFRKNTSELFDRNRIFVAIGYQVHPKLNFQLGYMNQYARSSAVTTGVIDHILQLSVSYNMDDLMGTFFKKPEK